MTTVEITSELPRLLATVKRPGDFFAAGELEAPLVRIEVDGVGVLGLPIPPVQAAALAGIAAPAPYGRGGATIVDPSVRRCGQIPVSAVHAGGPRWDGVLGDIVRDAAKGLGADGDIEAQLYKMLVYEAGGFFREHRDTEKAAGMFATLVVVLPSDHTGGALVVAHRGQEVQLQMGGSPFGQLRWAAFYADCLHELQPVQTGWRVALVYNLLRRSGPVPVAPDYGAEVDLVGALLRAWEESADGPDKLVIPLAHHYTPAELSFRTLKNEDAAGAGVLLAAAGRAGCEVRLAMVSICEEGAASGTYGRRNRWSSWEEDATDFEVLDVYERSETVRGWMRPDGTPDPRGPLPLQKDELCPPGSLDDEVPDEQHYHEATGNEGATFERTYRRAALVVWPSTAELALVLQGGLDGAVAHLKGLLASGSRDQAARLAAMLVAAWPRTGYPAGLGEARATLLEALLVLEDTDLVARFVEQVVAAGAFDGSEHVALVAALATLEPQEADRLLALVVKSAASGTLHGVALLVRVAESRQPVPSALAALVDVIGEAPPCQGWHASAHEKDRMLGLSEALRAVGASADRALTDRLAEAVLRAPQSWDLDAVVIPAVFEAGGPDGPARPAMGAILAACLDHLRGRVALPLVPPPDARRAAEGIGCACAQCEALRAFLEHPQRSTMDIKENAMLRAHVRDAVARGRADVDEATIEKGRPYTLRLTKNRASYERRVRQREEDLAALDALDALDE